LHVLAVSQGTDDIRKRNNLAEEKRDELHRLLKEWREKVGAPVPERKSGS
jgi:hypothetical protein